MFSEFLSRVDLINHVVGVPSMPCVTGLVGDLRFDQRIAHVHAATSGYGCHLRLVSAVV